MSSADFYRIASDSRVDAHDVGYISGYVIGRMEQAGYNHFDYHGVIKAIGKWLDDRPNAGADELKKSLYSIVADVN